MLAQPYQRLMTLGLVFSCGRGGWVVVAFAIATFETGTNRCWASRESPCGRCLRGSSCLEAVGSVLAWRMAYWVNLEIHGFPAAPWNRLFIWVLPIVIMAIWSFVINARAIKMEFSTHQGGGVGELPDGLHDREGRHGRSMAGTA